ncbi:MAG: hypothetical protein JWP67_1749 [Mucilaginibacter sp.]|jgi:hypothetical protein|nr:hypothetical protein [Mucilaginibacter sp.]MDB5061906.1 hypothetical protein [Mucilaginibacter sp.]
MYKTGISTYCTHKNQLLYLSERKPYQILKSARPAQEVLAGRGGLIYKIF